MPLNPEDENNASSRSGIIQAVEPRDPEKSLKKMLQKILGDEISVNNAMQGGTIAKGNIEKLKGDPIKELQTPGFFAMEYPTVFISGSCDITVPKLVKLDLVVVVVIQLVPITVESEGKYILINFITHFCLRVI